MKRTLILLLLLSFGCVAKATHIIGGEMSYTFMSRSATSVTYSITLKLFRICDPATNTIAAMPTNVYFTIFDKSNSTEISGSPYTVRRDSMVTKSATQIDPCILNPPPVCFQLGTFTETITVPINAKGYVVAFQSCCRDFTIINIRDIRTQTVPGNGASYFVELPGSDDGFIGNSSPSFSNDEAVLVCAGKKFTYDFSAKDKDGDDLTYTMTPAYGGGQPTIGEDGIPPKAAPPAPADPIYENLTYLNPYSGADPLGPTVTVDPKTGIISGTAPGPGKYVISVSVDEYRNGKKIGTVFKDFHLTVTTCVKLVEAAMPEKYNNCDGYTVTFLNNSTEGRTYNWDFGDGTTVQTNSVDPLPHTYSKDGIYTVKLYVDKTSNCGDSAIATAYVYPALKAAVSISGLCSNTTTSFINNSTTSSADDNIASYQWDFGVPNSSEDTSDEKNPQFKYGGPGDYQVVLVVTTARGCQISDTSNISIYDSPPLATTPDTLLCIRNAVQLTAQSEVDGNVVNGSYAWTPNYNIIGAGTATPTVSPKEDTTYTVTFTDGTGCVATRSVHIDVRDTLLIRTISDSTVCTGDQVHLRSFPDGNYPITWYDAATNTQVGDSVILNIFPPPPAVNYIVRGELGDCSGSSNVSLTVVDPPKAYAGEDTTICSGQSVTLHATGGAYYRWSPTYGLSTPQQATTIAKPQDTTAYIVTVTDVLGCPKPVNDTVIVDVVPPVPAFAGNDTIAILNQPFQLHATGGVNYVWTPADGLDNPDIADPFTNINHDITYTVTAYTAEGCSGTDDIRVRFIVGPDIYVPTGFSPNGDGQNDIFRPLPVGITQLEYFRVYDRWGKLMFSTSEYMQGWDGNFNGQPAAVGTYVWVVQGKDVNNETVQRKGTITLIR